MLFNSNFLEQTSDGSKYGYRGELVLVEGAPGDAKGHSKPPVEVMRGVAMLADDKILMSTGAIDRLEDLDIFIKKYQEDFSGDMLAVIFVVNIKEPMQVEIGGINFVLIPLIQGVPWNELIDELALEKSDFKGQSPADKIETLYNELKSYKPNYQAVSYDEALSLTHDIVREAWGAV